MRGALQDNNIDLNSSKLSMLYKKTEKGEKKYAPSTEELEQRQHEIVDMIGGDGETFDTCLRAVVGMIIEDDNTGTEIAFKYYIVCTLTIAVFFIFNIHTR